MVGTGDQLVEFVPDFRETITVANVKKVKIKKN